MLKFLKRAKGSTLNTTAKSIIGLYLKKKKLGELKNFEIDMENRKVNLSFIPKNFEEALTIEATDYSIEIDEKKQKSYLTFSSIVTSDNWDNSRFKELMKNKKIEIPEKYSKLVDLVV
jgi:hypothetical protein